MSVRFDSSCANRDGLSSAHAGNRLARCHARAGFTLVELIVTMVLMVILSVFAANRFFERDSYDARAFADQVTSMLHYGQKLAIAQNRAVYVRLNGTSVALCFSKLCSSGGDFVRHPSGSNSNSKVTKTACNNLRFWFCEGIPASITMQNTPLISGFYFDAQGKPFALGDVAPVSTFTTLTLKMISAQDGASTTLLVERETGYAHK